MRFSMKETIYRWDVRNLPVETIDFFGGPPILGNPQIVDDISRYPYYGCECPIKNVAQRL